MMFPFRLRDGTSPPGTAGRRRLRPRRGGGLLVFVVSLLGAASACTDSRPPTAPPDTTSPVMEVVFPAGGEDDRDGDGLLDLEVAFRDSASGIDPASITVTSVGGFRGSATSRTNLMEAWRVERADSTGFVLEETVENLLLRGSAQLQVRVFDREGNGSMVGVNVELPPAALHKVIDLRSKISIHTGHVRIGPEEKKAYVSVDRGIFVGSSLAIVDLAALEWEVTVQSPISALADMALDRARNRLYLASIDDPWVAVFDLSSRTFMSPIATSSRGIGVAYSATRDELYVGLEVAGPTNGFISVIDVGRGSQREVWDLGVNAGQRLVMGTLLLDSDEPTLYATTAGAAEGILVVDPERGALVGQIDLSQRSDKGIVYDLELAGSSMVATGPSGTGHGRVAVFPRDNPARMRFGLFPRGAITYSLDVAPDLTEYGVTTGDGGIGFWMTTLVDATTLEIVWADTTTVQPNDLVFHPDGHVFLVTQESSHDIDADAQLWVYLRR